MTPSDEAWLRGQLATLNPEVPLSDDAPDTNAPAASGPIAIVRRAQVGDLDAMRAFAGGLVEVTAYTAHDAAGALTGLIVLAIHNTVATLLQTAGEPAALAPLIAHITGAQNDFDLAALVIPPGASDWPIGPALEQLSGAKKLSNDAGEALSAYVLPI